MAELAAELKKLCPFSYARRKIEARRDREGSGSTFSGRSKSTADLTLVNESTATLPTSLIYSPVVEKDRSDSRT